METGLTNTEILGVVLIIILTAVEAVCVQMLREIHKERVEQRRTERIERLRQEAYAKVSERKRIKKARENLFYIISKGELK